MPLSKTDDARGELVSTARAMISNEINLIEGLRKITSLRFDVGDPDNEVFLSIRGMESETDNFPIGAMRTNCSLEFLERMDREMANYLADAKDDILQSCRDIIATFS